MLMNFHFIGKTSLECEDNFGSLRVWIFTTLMKVGSPCAGRIMWSIQWSLGSR